MNPKLLTVSVAAYNMEAYIRETLASLLSIEEVDSLEIFVVDDGGKDGTLSIAKEYEFNYPGVVHAIHKENGGYGSVQNYSIEHATGKYFKILDGDDWFDADGLENLLEHLKETNADVVITNYYKGPEKNKLEVVRISDKVGCSGVVSPTDLKYPVGMWTITYKTSILRKINLVLPEHTLYTDRIYSTAPFCFVKEVLVLDASVYCYRTGRDGQSVSIESRIKHIDEYLQVTKEICMCSVGHPSNKYVLLKAAYAYKVTIRALLLLPASNDNKIRIKDYENEIRIISENVYKKSASLKTKMGCIITLLRFSNYWAYWIFAKLPKKMVRF